MSKQTWISAGKPQTSVVCKATAFPHLFCCSRRAVGVRLRGRAHRALPCFLQHLGAHQTDAGAQLSHVAQWSASVFQLCQQHYPAYIFVPHCFCNQLELLHIPAWREATEAGSVYELNLWMWHNGLGPPCNFKPQGHCGTLTSCTEA